MKTIITILVALMLTGCAATGTKLVLEYPTPNGPMKVEATGDVLVEYNPETGNVQFITEQIKQEQLDAMTNFLDKFLAAFMGK